MLDANTCRLRLTSDEAVGGGYTSPGGIPPPLGSSIAVVVAGRGRVTGNVVNGTQTLDCPGRCSISGLARHDHVRLVATRGRFKRWSNGVSVTTQVVPLASETRIHAIFGNG
jgi:hypothetical protein